MQSSTTEPTKYYRVLLQYTQAQKYNVLLQNTLTGKSVQCFTTEHNHWQTSTRLYYRTQSLLKWYKVLLQNTLWLSSTRLYCRAQHYQDNSPENGAPSGRGLEEADQYAACSFSFSIILAMVKVIVHLLTVYHGIAHS